MRQPLFPRIPLLTSPRRSLDACAALGGSTARHRHTALDRCAALSRYAALFTFASLCGCNASNPTDEDATPSKKPSRTDDAGIEQRRTDSGTTGTPDASVMRSIEEETEAGSNAAPDSSDSGVPASTPDATVFEPPAGHVWQLIVEQPRATLLGVHGQSSEDVWMVGADDGTGPLLLHYYQRGWERVFTGLRSVDLWWVHTLGPDRLLLSGSRGTVATLNAGQLNVIETSGRNGDRVWGVWGSSLDNIYAVGSAPGDGGFLWHIQNGVWESLPLPADIPSGGNTPLPGLYKVWGASEDDIWVVGEAGTVLRGNADDGFEVLPTPVEEQLVGLAGGEDGVWTVGGQQTGILLQWDWDGTFTEFSRNTTDTVSVLQGAFIEAPGHGWVSGFAGGIYRVDSGELTYIDSGLSIWPETLHTLWEDPKGGVWFVGGDVFSTMEQGVAVYYGPTIPRYPRF